MTDTSFMLLLNHFIMKTRCSVDNKVLLILDKNSSHLSVEIIDHAKQNGITMLSSPPHTSHKLQSLDRTVFGPLKNTLMLEWTDG